MSMLTPPGLGGQYRIRGDRYPRMRRPRRRGRIIAASLASGLAVAVLGWGTLQLVDIFSGGDPGPDKAAADRPAEHAKCASPAATAKAAAGGRNAAGGHGLPEPGEITVNVLNATSRSGLAKDTADELKKRGFKIGKIANAPAEFDQKVEKAGVLIGAPGATTSDRLQVLGTQLEDTRTRYDERDGKDIDLVLGKGFERLAKKKAATAALAELTGSSPRPGKSASASGATC
ncbi:LytR C-terminal domain-containing protein [Streptomyces smyrnaeus]|uniref:LytR C-terminal domain-containing protein n=1 Tax=Streptomyces smyrnaeus TaxID=1387713 RepID=UPI0036ABB361